MDNYKDIDDLVFAYQSGDDAAGLLLIESFEKYMKKYMDLVKYRRYSTKDKDIARFISLFSSSETIPSPVEATNKVYSLSQICKAIGYEDLHQDMKMIILILAKRYKKVNETANFTGYLYNTFNYELFRRIKETSKNPMIFQSNYILSYDALNSYTRDQMPMLAGVSQEETSLLDSDLELNENWINGIFCDRAFVKLTNEERFILKCSYIEDMSDKEIAEVLGLAKGTVYNHRQKAENIVAEELGEKFIEALHRKRAKSYRNKKRRKG